MTRSLGQPGPWSWSAGVALGLSDQTSLVAGVGEVRVGVYRELLSRVLGAGGLQGEAYSQSLNATFHGGVRLRWVAPITGVALGADYSVTDATVRPIFTYVHPIRRGGLFRDGSAMRLDLVTGSKPSVTLGIEKPLLRRIPMGTTRPRSDRVRLPDTRRPPSAPVPDAPALRWELNIARDAARNIQRLVVPWLDHTGGGAASEKQVLQRLERLRTLASAEGTGLNADRETLRFHNSIDRAFSLALAGQFAPLPDTVDSGRRIGNTARAILLADVLHPYNYTLGQVKEHDTTHGLDVRARGAFLRWLLVESELPVATHDAVSSVFDALLDMVEDGRTAEVREWGSSRFVWLPLQYGLRAEQHDTQAELDAIIEQATAQSFTEGNRVSYVINEQFQNELSRTIRDAREYHVLWTHDFRGYNGRGEPDSVSFRHVVRSYLAALTARVRAYDATGTFPTYIILLDEWFYQVNKGRLWMNLLEDPTQHSVNLPADFTAWENSLRAAQESLRAAIASSRLLTAHRRQYGEAWLRNLVKVHVNITNAPDPSFWSWRVVTGFPLPDGWMRDHRKIVFYDLSETDAWQGEAILTGAGIGEHYVNDWEDRSLVVRGPVALRLKAAARDALIKQGIPAASIPTVLQTRGPSSVASQNARTTDQSLRAMQLQNGTGFDTKEVNVAKAVLYTLMPAGSVLKIPDSLWNGTFWGSALIGCALRGVRVVVIAPSLENAPARAFGSMIRSHELLWRLMMASRVLDTEISATGGMLKVGMFTSTVPVGDIAGRVRALVGAFAKNPWLGQLFPFATDSELARLVSTVDSAAAAHTAANGQTRRSAHDSSARAQLHLKANFFASREAWEVLSGDEWTDVLRAVARQRIAQVNPTIDGSTASAAVPDSALVIGDRAVQRWYDAMDPLPREHVMFYTVIGSANQNDRSMVSDGEAAFVLSRWPAVIPYLDLLLLVGQSTWVETPEQLAALLPPQGSLKTRLAHWFKHVF